MQKRMKYGIALLLMFGALGYLIVTGTTKAAAYYMTVDEVQAQTAKLVGKSVRVNGNLVGTTIKYDQASVTLTFDIVGEKGQPVHVIYKGIKPDNMNDDWEAIVEGKLTAADTVTASNVLMKCPSRYESAPVPAGYDPKNHAESSGGQK